MKTHFTFLAAIFILFNIISSNAIDDQAQAKPRHKPFAEMDEQNHQYPPGFNEIYDAKDAAVRLMKKDDAVQNNGDYLVESVNVYNEIGFIRRFVYTYNENKHILTESVYERRENEQWEDYSRGTYTYDENGNITTLLYEGWQNEQWVNDYKYTYTYDQDGNQLARLYDRWIIDRWIIVDKYTYTYDEDGNRLTELYQYKDNIELLNSWKKTYTYNNDGNHLTYLNERWENNQWVGTWKYTYTYNAKGNRLTDFAERWEDGEWVNVSLWKNTYSYDYYGNLLIQLGESRKNDELVDGSRYTYTYDNNGNRLTAVNESWYNGEWMNSVKVINTYDEDNNLLIIQQEFWVEPVWELGWRETNTYDNNGNRLTWLNAEWENVWVEIDEEFSFEDFFFNYYGEYNGYFVEIKWRNATSVENESDEEFSVNASPNPFNQSTIINYELTIPGNVTLNIYDILGNKITTLVDEFQDIGWHQAIFDAIKTGYRQPNGIYYYTIRIGGRLENGKLLLLR